MWGWFATVDHKEIGLRYLVTAFAFLIIGGVEALAIRFQLARPEASVLTPEQYDQIFTMRGVTMISFVTTALVFLELDRQWSARALHSIAHTAMPTLGLSDQDARDVAYLHTLR